AAIAGIDDVQYKGPPLIIDTSSLPPGIFGVQYGFRMANGQTGFVMQAEGGVKDYTWSSSGLPNGLGLSSDGVISGTPASVANYDNVQITVTDSASPAAKAANTYSITVLPQTVAPGPPPQPLSIVTASPLPDATAAKAYGAFQMIGSGGD